jgi:hypothetical protein
MPAGLPRLLAWYVGTRAALLALLYLEHVVLMDPRNWLVELDAHGIAAALPEYPWPAVLLLDLPLRLGVPTLLHYFATVIVFLLLLDAVMTWLLWRGAGRRLAPGVWLWVLFVPALGPLVLARFDLVPAVLAAGALLAARDAPGRAGTLAALGAAFKVWPAVLLPALLLAGERAARLRALGGFMACSVAVLVVTAVAAGWARAVSPFAMLATRGLHLEAFAALPLLWARYMEGGSRWSVTFSEACHCHELVGPGTGWAAAAGMLVLLAGAAVTVLLYARAFARPAAERCAAQGALLAAFLLLVWIVGARVFSPQFLLWLAAPLAVAGVLPGGTLRALDVALIVAAALLTQLVYPLGYEALLVQGHFLQDEALIALTLRDAVLAFIAYRVARRVLVISPAQ